MPVNFNTAISALDTPSSLLPFFIKDAFDVTGRTVMAHQEGGKHEAREKFIEEAGTSVFWIGGIPAIRAIANRIYKDKIDSAIHFKRINSNGIQNYFANELKESGLKKFSKKDLEGIEFGGEKLKEVAQKLKDAGHSAINKKGFYSKFHTNVTAAAVLINLAILSFLLPKSNQLLSKNIISKETKNNKDKNDSLSFQANNQYSFDKFLGTSKPNNAQKNPSFGSLKDLVNFKQMVNFPEMAEISQLVPVSSMLMLDWGISLSRVTITPRNKNERIENFVKEGGIIFFFYYASDIIKKGLSKIADKLKTPISLDYKVLNSPEFKEKLKNHKHKNEVLNFVELEENDAKSELKVIRMIDQELKGSKETTPKESLFKNFSLQMAQKEGLIDVEYDSSLGKWIRHSKKFIQTDKIIELNNNLKTFYEHGIENSGKTISPQNIERIINKTKMAKIASVFANMAICCASLSFIIPKIQYMIREHRTNTKCAPGIKHYQDMAQQNII